MKKSLKGRKILVTRATHQAQTLQKLIENEGGEAVLLPMIAIEEPEDLTEIKETFKQLEVYDWIVFTSVNAVEYFFNLADKFGVKFYFYPNLKIATVGEKTKLRLEQLGYRTNFVPIEYRAEVLAENMDENIEGKRILIPRSSKASDDYIRVFEKRRAQVDALTVYRNIQVQYQKNELLNLHESGLDSISFTSPSTVKSYVENFNRNHLPLLQAKNYCIGPSTAAEAKRQGLVVNGVASPYTEEGLVESISTE